MLLVLISILFRQRKTNKSHQCQMSTVKHIMQYYALISTTVHVERKFTTIWTNSLSN